jgi:hypothetical protein
VPLQRITTRLSITDRIATLPSTLVEKWSGSPPANRANDER